jgi:hypothetical protein
MYPLYTHYGTEFYGAGTQATTKQCTGQRDRQCSAGNLQLTVSVGHFSNMGVSMIGGGCGADGIATSFLAADTGNGTVVATGTNAGVVGNGTTSANGVASSAGGKVGSDLLGLVVVVCAAFLVL